MINIARKYDEWSRSNFKHGENWTSINFDVSIFAVATDEVTSIPLPIALVN